MPNVDSVYVDLVIGFAVAFFILSLVPSGLGEALAFVTRIRSKFLWAYLNQLFTVPAADAAADTAASEASRAVAPELVPAAPAGEEGGAAPVPGPTPAAAAAAFEVPPLATGKDGALGLPTTGVQTVGLMFRARNRDPRPATAATDAAGGDSFVDVLLRQLRPIDIGRKRGKTTVKYIPPVSFAQAVLETLQPPSPAEVAATVADVRATIEQRIEQLRGTPIYSTLKALWETSERDLAKFRQNLERWFDAEMARLSGLYKRTLRWVLALAAIAVAFLANVDPVALGRDLWRDPDRRASLVELAETTSSSRAEADADADPESAADPEMAALLSECRRQEGAEADAEVESVDQAARQVTRVRNCVVDAIGSQQQLGLLNNSIFEMERFKDSWSLKGAPGRGLRLLLVAAAIYLGAPFWYDVVKRLSGARRAVTHAET
jgi:hypothetical protein